MATKREDDVEYWVRPPLGDDGALPWVDMWLSIERVGLVDTVGGTAFVKITVVMYWTDPRLRDWPQGKKLPPALWGPALQLKNTIGDHKEEDYTFELFARNARAGRLKRARFYVCTIDNPMDLQQFPFDLDIIDATFWTLSSFKSLNGLHEGNAQAHTGKTYRLRKVRQEGEGSWVALLSWRGAMAEWDILGVSTSIEELPPKVEGIEITQVTLGLHVARRSKYYVWKALLPLYMLTGLSMGTFHFDTEDLEGRYATVSTFFLAAFAMLYVVGEALPRTDFLTKIDTVIVITTTTLFVTGISALALAKVHKTFGQDVADRCNLIVECVLIGAYVLANLVIFVPAWVNQRRVIAQLSNYVPADYGSDHSSKGVSLSDSESDPLDAKSSGGKGDALPGVPVGHEYVTFQHLVDELEQIENT